ncbi:MAG: hypothetical protein MH204_00020, partial [Fimbriimonadaceae bacterium]|nr:hypothetical protein [Fimbriimonadaceae bacterium]
QPGDLEGGRFFGGPRVGAGEAKILAESADGHPLITRKDRVWFFAPDLGRTLGLMLGGAGGCGDAVGPGDGSAFTADGISRAEDRTALDWAEDRQDSGGTPVFARPYADLLADAWIRVVLAAVESVGRPWLLLHPLPAHRAAVLSVLIEDPGTEAEDRERRLRAMLRFGLRSCWLFPAPGPGAAFVRTLRGADQGVGLLARDGSLDDLRLQSQSLGRLFGQTGVPLVRLENGRWPADPEWGPAAEAIGIMGEAHRCGRQPGTTGFLFGTTRPFFAGSPQGRLRRLASLPGALHIPGGHQPFLVAAAGQVARLSGSLLVSLSTEMAEEDFNRMLQSLYMTARQHQMLPLSPDQLARFVVGRRSTAMEGTPSGVRLESEIAVPGLTLATPAGIGWQGRDSRSGEMHGRSCLFTQIDLEGRAPMTLQATQANLAA